jgi:hypothetical protein
VSWVVRRIAMKAVRRISVQIVLRFEKMWIVKKIPMRVVRKGGELLTVKETSGKDINCVAR